MNNWLDILKREFMTGFNNGFHCFFAPFTAAWRSLRQGGNYFRHLARIYREHLRFGIGEGKIKFDADTNQGESE